MLILHGLVEVNLKNSAIPAKAGVLTLSKRSALYPYVKIPDQVRDDPARPTDKPTSHFPLFQYFNNMIRNAQGIRVDGPGISNRASGRHEAGIGNIEVGNIMRTTVFVKD